MSGLASVVSGRRAFVRGGLALLFAGGVSLPWVRRRSGYLLNRFHIAGFRFHSGPRLLPHLLPGTPLVLQAEPGHPVDRFAVRICWRGHLIGYIPRTDNRHLSRLLRQGAELEARIIGSNAGLSTTDQLRIEVQLPT